MDASQTRLRPLLDLGPGLQRLVRERPTPRLPGNLTVTERRMLTYVSAGLSNPEIAEQCNVATSTVRKHLEHVYRKLGVFPGSRAASSTQGVRRAGLRPPGTHDRYA